jgi:hypothetical protein
MLLVDYVLWCVRSMRTLHLTLFMNNVTSDKRNTSWSRWQLAYSSVWLGPSHSLLHLQLPLSSATKHSSAHLVSRSVSTRVSIFPGFNRNRIYMDQLCILISNLCWIMFFPNLCSYNTDKLASYGDLLHPPCGTTLTFLWAQGNWWTYSDPLWVSERHLNWTSKP